MPDSATNWRLPAFWKPSMDPVRNIKLHAVEAIHMARTPFDRMRSAGWQPYSRLILVRDQADWVIDEEMRALSGIAGQLGIREANRRWIRGSRHQSVFYGSQFFLLADDWLRSTHHIGVAYFHGKPGTGVKEFDNLYKRLCQYHTHVCRIQASHSEMRDCLLATGIAPEKVHLIPIGINLNYFRVQTADSRQKAREQFGIPQSAVVVGSFQKDGSGWDEGLEPKLIKGPDVFLATINRLRDRIPELFVVLSGPARGYVKTGLEALGVPYRHFLFDRYSEVGKLFQTLDCYLITSRQEGGPKAVLESMASGVPLVSTRVGQAMDMVNHGINGFMVGVEDSNGLADWAEHILTHPSDLPALRQAGRATAESHSYGNQVSLWSRFLEGFVECSSHE